MTHIQHLRNLSSFGNFSEMSFKPILNSYFSNFSEINLKLALKSKLFKLKHNFKALSLCKLVSDSYICNS